MGVAVPDKNWIFFVHLFDIVPKSPDLCKIFQAITSNIKPLAKTFGLMLIFLYAFGIVACTPLPASTTRPWLRAMPDERLRRAADNIDNIKNDFKTGMCDSIISCTVVPHVETSRP